MMNSTEWRDKFVSDSCDFSNALKRVKSGSRIARRGWNGKDMFVTYQPGYPDGVSINENTQKALNLPAGTIVKFLPYLMMKTVDGSCVPWLASQTDILAEDWFIVF